MRVQTRISKMKGTIDLGFAERRQRATDAKRRLLEKLAPRLQDTPEASAKREARAVTGAARDERRAERDRLKQERADREKADAQAKAEAELSAASLAREAELNRQAQTEAAGKAERDRRYAARQARRR
jgi:uncharacterized protein DUF6481